MEKYTCKLTMIMEGTNSVAFIKGKVYTTLEHVGLDIAFTDEGNDRHLLSKSYVKKYFTLVKN